MEDILQANLKLKLFNEQAIGAFGFVVVGD